MGKRKERPSSGGEFWTMQLYDYAEHLFWRPSVIGRVAPKKRVKKKDGASPIEAVFREEISLNTLTNIMLRLLPSRHNDRILKAADFSHGAEIPEQAQLTSPQYDAIGVPKTNVTYPDTVFACRGGVVFLEMKIDAPLKREQIWKYIFAAACWRRGNPDRPRPYLVLLSRKSLSASVLPAVWRKEVFVDAAKDEGKQLQEFLVDDEPPTKLGTHTVSTQDRVEMTEVLADLTIGHLTWQRFGDSLQQILRSSSGRSDDSSILGTLLGDYLKELGERGLWERSL